MVLKLSPENFINILSHDDVRKKFHDIFQNMIKLAVDEAMKKVEAKVNNLIVKNLL